MLQECAATPDLGRSDELALVHEDLAADRGCKAGRRMGGWADGRMVPRQHSVGPQGPQCPPRFACGFPGTRPGAIRRVAIGAATA